MSDEEKNIKSFERYIISQKKQLDEYYKLDDSEDSFYKDEITELELTIPLLKNIDELIKKQNNIIKAMAKELTNLLEASEEEIIERFSKINPDLQEFCEKYCKNCCEKCEKGIIETSDFIRCIDKNITKQKK